MSNTPASWLSRHEFLIRRLHSLSGLIPVGAFLCMHLLTNASVLGNSDGKDMFQENVNKIHALGPLLVPVEILFIFLPLLFHVVIGFVIIKGGLSNTGNYPYVANFRYTLQRWTGGIAFAFIMYHLYQMHWLGEPLAEYGGAQFDPHNATATAAATIQSGVFVQIVYAVGILASVYHLANGIWTMGITWGVWISPAAQRRANYICGFFGILLALVGLGALSGFMNVHVSEKEHPNTHAQETAEAKRVSHAVEKPEFQQQPDQQPSE